MLRLALRGLCLLPLLSVILEVKTALPCGEIHSDLAVPCRCDVRPTTLVEQGIGVLMDCDHVVFAADLPQLPHQAPIIGFSQRHAGHQTLPSQMFGRLELPLQKLDFSHNSLRRLPDRLFSEVYQTLEELYLGDNIFGDNLNPIFASSEFRVLSVLKVLDLAGNQIRGLEEGIFRGCTSLQDLRLDRNLLNNVPSASLRGPQNLRSLSLMNNNIETLKQDAFTAQQNLERIRLDGNNMQEIEGGAFTGLSRLRELTMANNKLSRFNSDVFQALDNLERIDLSQNFLSEVPEESLKLLPHLKQLNLSSNQIREVRKSLNSFSYMESLDLSRNNIASIPSRSFENLRRLRRLDLSVNSLRTVEDDTFEGLDNLEILSLEDNNILLVPASAFGRLPRLAVLNLSYNRISAVSQEILRSFATNLISLSLAKNVIREIPDGTFEDLIRLKILDLEGNLLNRVDGGTFSGLGNSLESLNLAENKLSSLNGSPLMLSVLRFFDLSGNRLGDIPKTLVAGMPNLKQLNLSNNEELEHIPSMLFHGSTLLSTLDISKCGLESIHPDLFARAGNLKVLKMSDNKIQNISEAFKHLKNLTYLDLSNNYISNIRAGSLGQNGLIKTLLLDGNKLNAFKGEFFKAGKGDYRNYTSLEILSISNNELTYLFPSSFKIHPKLKLLSASNNKFTYFPAELISDLQYLERIDLSHNKLKAVEDMDFSRLPRLRELQLADNAIETVSESAFHNSTQLQILNFSENQVTRLAERTFEGLYRLELLNMQGNRLTDLPESIFDRSKLRILENIDLSRNQFKIPPLKALQRQYFFLTKVNLSENFITDIPPEDSTLVNVKNLDLSYNPLSAESLQNILEEPKTVRELSLAGVNVENITHLEMPFLKLLDLSHNNISKLSADVFQRSTMLADLKLSDNKIRSLADVQIWGNLAGLQNLDISMNPLEEILGGHLDNSKSLKKLNMYNLNLVMKIEKNAFKSLENLKSLSAYGFPRLGYLDVRGILQYLPTLTALDIEVKDATVSSDELTYVMHPRLQYLGLRGKQITSISTGIFAGLKSPAITLKLVNTSVTTLPQGLFFPLPRSSYVALDVSDSQLSTLSQQFLNMFEDHRKHLELTGLNSNPITCDCSARALKKWLVMRNSRITCQDEVHFGRLINEVPDEELSCEPRKTTETVVTTKATPLPTRKYVKTTTEADIIWTMAPKKKTTAKPPKLITSANAAAMNNDDMLIISIVGGVVAFIIILVIVICIIRMRMVNTPYRGGPLATPVPYAPSNACIYSVKPGSAPSLYMAPSYATLPHKMASTMDGSSSSKPYPVVRPQSQLQSYYQTAPPPSQSAYYIPYQPDEKIEYR